MASLERQRWSRFAWNAVRYALGPIGGILVPWVVVGRSGALAWGEALTIIIPIQVMLSVAMFGSKDLLLKSFAGHPAREPRALATESLITRAMFVLPIALALGLTARGGWPLGAGWFFAAFAASSFDVVFVWRKQFVALLVADLSALIVQCVFLFTQTSLSFEPVMFSFLLHAITRLGVVGMYAKGWPPLLEPFDAMSVSVKRHVIDAFPFFLIGFSGLLASRIDLYTANALLDRAEVGRYQIVSSLFIQFQAIAALVVLPMTRDLYRLNIKSVSRYAQRMRAWALAGLLPMCALAWAVFTFLFRFELPWSVYAGACAMVWPVFAYVPYINQLYKHGRERNVMWANFAAAGLTCLLTVVLLPVLGTAGGLLAAAAGQWLMITWMSIEQRRLHAVPGM